MVHQPSNVFDSFWFSTEAVNCTLYFLNDQYNTGVESGSTFRIRSWAINHLWGLGHMAGCTTIVRNIFMINFKEVSCKLHHIVPNSKLTKTDYIWSRQTKRAWVTYVQNLPNCNLLAAYHCTRYEPKLFFLSRRHSSQHWTQRESSAHKYKENAILQFIVGYA